MNIHPKSTDRISLTLAIAFLSVNICMLVWYIFVGYQAWFHSDSAAKVLLAREIWETGKFFPPEWNYVNNDLSIIFKPAFILPLLTFLPAGYMAHAISGLISSGLILAAVWFLSGRIKADTTRRVWTVAIVAAGISGFMAENLFGQVSYGTIFFFSCCILLFSCHCLKEDEKNKKYFGSALLIVLMIVFWSNPQRAAIYYGMPLFLSIIWYVVKKRFKTGKTVWFLSAVVFGGIILGTVLHVSALSNVQSISGAGHARWLSYDLMLRNLCLTLKSFLAIFGGLPTSNGLVVSKNGIYEAARLGAALIFLLLIPFSMNRALREQDSGIFFIAAFAFFACCGLLFLHVATTVPDMSDPIQSSRYLVPPLLLLLILILPYPAAPLNGKLVAISSFIVAILFVTSGYTTYCISAPSSIINWGMEGQHYSRSKKLSDFLIENGLHYGYATYWNAGMLSVLSNEKVLVRQILIDHGLPVPMRHLSSDRWYRPRAWEGASFLLLTKKQSESIDWDLLKRYHGEPLRVLSFDKLGIYVYPHNLSKGMPGWDKQIEAPVTFFVSKYSPKQVGHFVEEAANGGPAVIAEKGESGALHFGPYVDVDPGSYKATFDVIAHHNSKGAVRLDVAASLGRTILNEKVLTSSNGAQTLFFSLEKRQKLEFRVIALGSEKVVFRSVSLEKQP